MEVRITWRSEIYIKGEDIDEIRNKWEALNIDPIDNDDEDITNFDFVELVSVEDADTYDDLMDEF